MIRLKLVQFLTNWHPSDTKITNEIIKWRSTFDEKSWMSLMNQYVIPKLSNCLNKLEVNPKNQQIDPINWVNKWQNALFKTTIATLFVQNLLPKWLEILNIWISTESVDLEEVMEWYFGWKSILPSEIIKIKNVEEYFKTALILINSVV